MSITQDPIRQQLIEARRNQILEAAARVFAEKGFHRATTRHIASEAGVAEGTIYNYFDSKGDLLIGIMMRLSTAENVSTELTEALDEDARGLLLAIARHRLAQPLVIPFTTYLESVYRVTNDPCCNSFNPTIQAISSMRLLVVLRNPPEYSFLNFPLI